MGTRTSRGSAAKAAAFGVVACVVAACSGAGAGAGADATTTPFTRATTPSDATTVAPGCLVAAAWNNYSEERLGLLDQPAIEGQIQAAGGRYVWADAKSSADTQVEEIGQFVKDGAKVIIVRPMVADDTDAASISDGDRQGDRRRGRRHRLRLHNRQPEGAVRRIRSGGGRADGSSRGARRKAHG